MEKTWIDKISGVEYKDVLLEDTSSCCFCPLVADCEAQPCPDVFHIKTGNVYPNLQQAVDELIDYLSSLPELPPFAGDEQKEEMIKKFVHLKSTKD